MKKYIVPVLFLCLFLLCSCNETVQVPLQQTEQQVTVAAAVDAIPYATIGSTVPGGAMVTSYSPDGSCYYAAFNYEDGQKAVEFTYDAPSGKVLFRADYYYENGMLSSVISQTTSERGYGYTMADGSVAVCKKTEAVYKNGQKVLEEYTDFSGNRFAKILNRYGTDGGYVSIWQENGKLRQLRSVAPNGVPLFTSDSGIVTGTCINCGTFGQATVASVGADGSYTLYFSDRTHRLSDGTIYAGLDLFVVVNAKFETTAAVYSKNGTSVCEYQALFAADGSASYDYYEYGSPVCRLQTDRLSTITGIVSTDGGDYFSTTAVTVGKVYGQGSVCELNDDGSFTVVYFNRPYLHTDGTFTKNTTLYAFFDAGCRLAGNKYYTGNQILAQCDYTYNTDGSCNVKITEGEKITNITC